MDPRPLIPALLLAACTVGPDYAGPPRMTGDAAPHSSFVRADAPGFATAPAVARWWETLGDPTLDGLVEEALARSPTVEQARARFREAQAQLRQQRRSLLPSVSSNATYLHAELPGIDIEATEGQGGQAGADGSGTALDFYNLGLNASWEIDLFGGGRRGTEQARASAGARGAELADAQVSLSSQVAQAYVSLRDAQKRIDLSRRGTTVQERRLALVRQRLEAGTASQLDVERLRAQLDSARAEALPLGAQLSQALDRLAVLTGRAPGALDAILAKVEPVPLPPAEVAIGDPARLIAHRPDVRAAERQLAAATAAIGVSRAKELPTVRFLGLLGLGGTHPEDVLDLGNLTALAAPSLSWSFLDFGRNREATRRSEAQRDGADAAYRGAVLEALRDAEGALSRFAATRAQLGRLAQARTSSMEAVRLSRQRTVAGTGTMVDQLEAERLSVSADDAVQQARARLADDYVAVQKALGLGWTEPPFIVAAAPAQSDPSPR